MNKTFEELFNEMERQIIDTCIKFGNYSEVPTQLDSNNCPPMSPERERALEEYINQNRVIDASEDSEVKQEMEVLIAKGELVIDSPEKEAEWQAKIDAEKAEKQAKLQGTGTLAETPAVPVTEHLADDLSEVESQFASLSKQEIMDKLKELNVDFKPAQPKAELLSLLELQTAK